MFTAHIIGNVDPMFPRRTTQPIRFIKPLCCYTNVRSLPLTRMIVVS